MAHKNGGSFVIRTIYCNSEISSRIQQARISLHFQVYHHVQQHESTINSDTHESKAEQHGIGALDTAVSLPINHSLRARAINFQEVPRKLL